MRTLLKIWLPIMEGIALALVAVLAIRWSAMSVEQRLSFALAICLVMHAYEEEQFPGGFAFMFNVLRARSDVPDRYTASPLIAMVVDVVIFAILLASPLVLPPLQWLATAVVMAIIAVTYMMSFVMYGIPRPVEGDEA